MSSRAPLPEHTPFRRSSHSGNTDDNNDCVEVAFTSDGALVRDSKDEEGGILRFTAAGWIGLLNATRAGKLNP